MLAVVLQQTPKRHGMHTLLQDQHTLQWHSGRQRASGKACGQFDEFAKRVRELTCPYGLRG